MSKKQRPYYGKTTKKKVVFDYEHSSTSLVELSRLHGILGSNTVANWIGKYGNSQKKKPKSMSHSSPADQERRIRQQRSYEQMRISELEAELEDARIRVQFYACALTVASEATGLDLLKKTGELLSKWLAKNGK